MSCFYQINTIYEYDKEIGCTGIDINTGECKTFTYYNCSDIYTQNNLYEFKSKNANISVTIKENQENITDGIINYTVQSLIHSIESHNNYNLKCDLPNKYLLNNSKRILLQFDDCDTSYGLYNPIGNLIYIMFENLRKINFNSRLKKDIFDTSIHEIGHMKAARIEVDITKKILIATIGFYSIIYEVEPIRINNGDIFLKVKNTIIHENDYIDEMLEEIINDAECFEINRSYLTGELNYGKHINELCDKKLNLARYTGGMDVYYECMTKIIPHEYLAKELLDLIYNARGKNVAFCKPKRDAMKLIREYTKTKNRL